MLDTSRAPQTSPPNIESDRPRTVSRLDRLLGLAEPRPSEDCLPPDPVRAALVAAADRSEPNRPAMAHARDRAATLVGFTAAFLAVGTINLLLPLFGRLQAVLPEWDYTGPTLAVVLVFGAGFIAFALARRVWSRTAPPFAAVRSAGLLLSMALAVLSVGVLS
jgi:hypothetical protein